MSSKNLTLLIAGGHASGKKTTAEWIKREIELLPEYSPSTLAIEVIDMKKYMANAAVKLSGNKMSAITVGNNHLLGLKPSRVDFEALKADLRSRTCTTERCLIIIHGLYALYDKELCDMSQIKVYIGGDADTRLIRWIRRDVLPKTENSTNLETVINTYLHGAKQEMSDFIFPTKERADVIMPRGAEANAVSLIVDGIVSSFGSGHTTVTTNTLRPNAFENERFNNQKGKYYELN